MIADLFRQLVGQLKDENTNNSVNDLSTPTTDPTFTSGLNYARSIADGQNVPNMISPGTSYSSAMPQGFTQADINSGAVSNPFSMISGALSTTPPQKLPGPVEEGYGQGVGGVTIFDDIFDIKRMPPRDLPPGTTSMFGGDPRDLPIPLSSLPRFDQDEMAKNISRTMRESGMDFTNLFGVPGVGTDGGFIGGPVDMPIPPKQKDQLFIDDMPRFIEEDFFKSDYVVPEVPLNNLLNQNPPQGPVGMSPQETAKMSSQQELLNLMSNKDILKEIPADDGVRNQYQVELDEYINKSPINMDTYKEELPIGSAINLGIPSIMETVAPMAIPGLGLATNISNSFQNDFSPSPKPSPAPSVSSFTPGIDYSSIYKFGR